MPPVGLPPILPPPPRARPRVAVQAPTLPPIILARAPVPTRQQVAAAHYTPPAPTRPVYVPPTPAPAGTRTGYNPRGVAIAPAPKPTINDLHARTLAAMPGDQPGPGGDYGSAAVNALKQTDAYKQSVLEVFLHQNAYQRQAIVSGALHNQASPEAKTILDYVKRTGGGPAGGSNLVPAAVYGAAVRATMPPLTGVERFLQHGAQDIANLAPGTLEGLWNVGEHTGKSLYYGATGQFGKQLAEAKQVEQATVGPFIQMATHPSQIPQDVYQHPVNTALMFLGAKAALGKGIGAAGRAAGADWASTAREPLSLGTVSGEPTAAPLAEERSYSKDILNKGVQVAREKAIRAMGQNPNIARPAPKLMPETMQNVFNIGQEAKLRRVGNEMASVQQTLQRAERGRMTHEANTAAPKSKVARNVVTHVLQAVVRTPQTATEDILSEIQRLRNARTHSRSQHNLWNKKQVRDLETALNTPGALDEAFATADRLRPTLQGQDTVLGERGILTPEEIAAKYFPYAQKHMGATYDENLGRLVNAQYPDGIPTEVIQEHLQGWRDVTNPEFERASRVHENAQRVRAARQAEHNQAAAEYRAARQQHRNVSAIAEGRPTPEEISKMSLLRTLRDRPGTPGEGAAAAAALERIETRIRGRGGNPDPAALRAAEQRLAAANAARQQTRVNLNNATEGSYRAQEDLAATPRTVRSKVGPEVPDPAYVGHYSNKATPGQFYMRYQRSRGQLSKGKRTGEAFRLGGYDHTYEGLTGQMAARAQAVVKAGIHDRLVQRSYLKPKALVEGQVRQEWAKARDAMAGKTITERARIERATREKVASLRTGMYTAAEAERIIHAQPRDDAGNLMPGEIEMVPIRAAPAKSIDWVRDLQNPMQQASTSDIETQALQRAIDEAKDSTNQARNVVLAPKVLVDQLTRQFAPGGGLERGVGRWVQQFRNTVLPYSTHWMTQIGTEAMLRSALAGIFSPHYIADAKALYERLGKTEAGRAAAAEMTGATFYGQHGAMGIYHSPNPVLRTAQGLMGPRNLIAAHKWYVHQVGRLMYSFEHNARMAGLGKLMHDHAAEIREFGQGWQGALRLQGRVIDQIAHGLEANPALVAKFGRKIDDLFGQYGKYSPKTRAIIQSVAPFLPWYMTATKYVFWQLPAHHPISSALLASLRQTVNQDVADGQKEPLNPYAVQAFGTLSPFGIFTPKSGKFSDVAAEAAQKGASLFLPQAAGSYNALLGRDPFGNQLKGPGGAVAPWSLPAIGQAINAAGEATFPLATKARQVLEGGRPSYATSSLIAPQPKPGGGPGDLGQILNRTLNPFYSLQRAQKAKPSGRGGGSSGLKRFGGGGGSLGSGMKSFR